jgi:dTDP-4-dehydrorhamnose reductase
VKYFVIGASGLVGSNLLSYLRSIGVEARGSHLQFATEETVFFNPMELDHPSKFSIADFKPDVIVHCGALTNVDYCETHEEESFQKTVVSAQNIALLCQQLGCKLVYISTDYVFNGEDGPYTEAASPAPLNLYGQHKLQAEEVVQKGGSDSLIIRITNVYGDELRNKNFISRILTAIQKGEALDMVLPSDQFATPVNAADVARAVYQLVEESKSGIYHLGSTDLYNRFQLFSKVVDHFPSYTNYKVRQVATVELAQPAKRPLLGGLLSQKFLSEFPDFRFSNVDDYLSRKKHEL